MSSKIISIEPIQNKIYFIRGKKVMLDIHLAKLYGVETKQLKRAVRRNLSRFPVDFMFELTKQEYGSLKRQIGTLKNESNNLRCQFGTSKRGGRRYLPFVFTEQGVAMLSGVLNSERAIQVNIAIMRTFAKLREVLIAHKDLAHKLSELEHKIGRHDAAIQNIFEAIRRLMAPPPETPRRKIGF